MVTISLRQFFDQPTTIILRYIMVVFYCTIATCIFSSHLYNAQHCSLEVTKGGKASLCFLYLQEEHCNLKISQTYLMPNIRYGTYIVFCNFLKLLETVCITAQFLDKSLVIYLSFLLSYPLGKQFVERGNQYSTALCSQTQMHIDFDLQCPVFNQSLILAQDECWRRG